MAAAAGIIGSILGGSGDGLLSPTAYMGAGMKSAALGQEAEQRAWTRRHTEDKFNLEKMLAMQDYREKERRKKWQRDFSYALGGM